MIKITDKKRKLIKNLIIIAFLLYIFSLCFIISIKTDFNTAPDEKMKYDVCEYVYKNLKLPHGGDESIRDQVWGISYAFTPIFSYMISAIFMKITSIFTESSVALVVAARLVSVLCITGYTFMCIKISQKLFKGIYRWVFVAFTTLLPQLIYLGSYINNDSLALLSISVIIYAWLEGLEKDWNWKSCIILAIGIGICALSYYNAYGYILTSVIIYFISSYIKRMDIKEFLKKGFAIAGIAFVIAGWWFIRNFIIYDGDFLGLNTSREYGQMYAQEMYKPTNRSTPAKQKITLSDMLFGEMDWVEITKNSFIGRFGYMTIQLDQSIYNMYEIIGKIGIIGLVFGGMLSIINKNKNNKKENKYDSKYKKEKVLFNIIMIINIIITISLSIYYSYFMDYQPQGRYIMPMIIPFMYFLVIGIKNIFDTVIKNEKIKTVLCIILILILIIMSIYISFEYIIIKL